MNVMKKREPLSSIMTKDPVTVNINATLNEVRDLMGKHGFRHFPVVSGDELVGIISQTDVMRLSFGNVFDNQKEIDQTMFDMLTIEDVMMTNPTSVPPGCTVGEVANLLIRVDFHALPVVEGKKLVGIVSTTDVIRYFLRQMD